MSINSMTFTASLLFFITMLKIQKQPAPFVVFLTWNFLISQRLKDPDQYGAVPMSPLKVGSDVTEGQLVAS